MLLIESHAMYLMNIQSKKGFPMQHNVIHLFYAVSSSYFTAELLQSYAKP